MNEEPLNRRSFIQRAVVGLPVAGLPVAPFAFAQDDTARQQRTGVVVRTGKDRLDEPYDLGVGHMECKVSGRDTGGALAIFEALTHKDDRPVRHLHHQQDEWFFVLEGEYEIHVGEIVSRIGPGDSVFAPRRVPHVWGCVSESPGRILALLQPAGTIEAFFRELPRYIARKASIEELQELNRRHGMEVLGPRLPLV
jgi:mannose-6-phosphate isomerase-like protein (cupin superfamily)